MATRERRIVLFVGAGCSRAFGYALTRELLPITLERLALRKFRDRRLRKHARLLRSLLGELLPGLSGKTSDDAAGILSVLSILDHCIVNGEMPHGGKLSLDEARRLLDRAIVEVLTRPIHKGQNLKPVELARWVKRCRREKAQVTVISTNYDVSLDVALLDEILGDRTKTYPKVDFGFTWRDPDDDELVTVPASPWLRLYKLHGSLNWLACPRSGYIYVSFEESLADLAYKRGPYSVCQCGHRSVQTVLVTPSFVRSVRDPNLVNMWRSAGEALRSADQWIFIGYSLPPEDIAIRSMLIRARARKKKTAPRIRVVDPVRRHRVRSVSSAIPALPRAPRRTQRVLVE